MAVRGRRDRRVDRPAGFDNALGEARRRFAAIRAMQQRAAALGAQGRPPDHAVARGLRRRDPSDRSRRDFIDRERELTAGRPPGPRIAPHQGDAVLGGDYPGQVLREPTPAPPNASPLHMGDAVLGSEFPGQVVREPTPRPASQLQPAPTGDLRDTAQKTLQATRHALMQKMLAARGHQPQGRPPDHARAIGLRRMFAGNGGVQAPASIRGVEQTRRPRRPRRSGNRFGALGL